MGVLHISTAPTTTDGERTTTETEPTPEVDNVKFRCDRDALSEALQTVQRLCSNDASALAVGQVQYSLLCYP